MNYRLMKCMLISYPKNHKDIPTTWDLNISFLKNFI
jgi:hypothetical protein